MPGQKTQGLGLLLYRLTEAAYSRQPRGPEVQDLGEGPFQWPPSVRRLLPVSLLRPPSLRWGAGLQFRGLGVRARVQGLGFRV